MGLSLVRHTLLLTVPTIRCRKHALAVAKRSLDLGAKYDANSVYLADDMQKPAT
jgi:hypothetical protein